MSKLGKAFRAAVAVGVSALAVVGCTTDGHGPTKQPAPITSYTSIDDQVLSAAWNYAQANNLDPTWLVHQSSSNNSLLWFNTTNQTFSDKDPKGNDVVVTANCTYVVPLIAVSSQTPRVVCPTIGTAPKA